jgi:osmotically-inducible protein OsmY
MHQHRSQSVLAVLSAAVVAVALSIAATAQTPPDNSKVNARDRAKSAPTADQQKENANDRQLTQKIRQTLMQNKSLSSYAHNVKVIAQGGQVTLKGPVRSEQEKKTVEAAATEVAGAGHVTNEISIAPAKSSKK